MRAAEDIENTIDTHGDTVWRVCVLYFKQSVEAQDAFQETFLKYSLRDDSFRDEDHRRAWLIRVTVNTCKDMLKAAHRKNLVFEEGSSELLSSTIDFEGQPESSLRDVLEAMIGLSDPPRTPVYLALYEGYTAPEIADMLDASVNTVYSWIARGKQQLKEALK